MIFNKILLSVFILCFSILANAHTPSSSYLFIKELDSKLKLRWDISLRDLDYVLGLDLNQDHLISWKELKSKRKELSAYALSNLVIKRSDKNCELNDTNLQVVKHTDGAYAVLGISAECFTTGGQVSVNYSLFFEEDSNHRGVVFDKRTKKINSYIASPDQHIVTLKEYQSSIATLFTFIKQGIWHILIGYDHIIFVISLMLPLVLLYRKKEWIAVTEFKPALINLFKVITAFTIAHSITLSLAALDIISLSSRWIESAIALSVLIVALNNIRPFFMHTRWSMAFFFGLVHGFGFASVLRDLDLSTGSLFLSLLGFNLGVELGQGILILLFFPLAYHFRKTEVYREVVFKGGSIVIAFVASFWVFQRIIYVS